MTPASAIPSASEGDDEGEGGDRRRPGRPRSERARTAILDAAAELLFSSGYGALTVAAVAERAGVGKATIYKWWPSKAAVAVDAFLWSVQPHVPSDDVGDVRRELADPALAQLRLFRDTPIGAALASFVAAAQSDPVVGMALRERWLGPRRREAVQAVERAKERGEIRADVDGELVLDMIFGPIYYRLLAGHQPLPDELVERLVHAVLHGVLAPAG